MADRPYRNLKNEKFGRLLVLRECEESRPNNRLWRCRCDCGVVLDVLGNRLIGGNNRSCGCLRREVYRTVRRTHGQSYTRTYRAWADMIQRCRREPAYLDVKVCDRWLNSFEAFLEDMGECPDEMTLDRRNPFLDYEKDNCRWADWETQHNNKRDTTLLTMNGVTKPLQIWAKETGIHWNVIRMRVKHLGWSHEKALTTKDGSNRKLIEYQGRTQSLVDWCSELGLNYSRTRARLGQLGWSVEDAFTKPHRRKKAA